MNGSKSTFKWEGYLLTALTAIVLLAASPGTAQAQDAQPKHCHSQGRCAEFGERGRRHDRHRARHGNGSPDAG